VHVPQTKRIEFLTLFLFDEDFVDETHHPIERFSNVNADSRRERDVRRGRGRERGRGIGQGGGRGRGRGRGIGIGQEKRRDYQRTMQSTSTSTSWTNSGKFQPPARRILREVVGIGDDNDYEEDNLNDDEDHTDNFDEENDDEYDSSTPLNPHRVVPPHIDPTNTTLFFKSLPEELLDFNMLKRWIGTSGVKPEKINLNVQKRFAFVKFSTHVSCSSSFFVLIYFESVPQIKRRESIDMMI
jgi:hypothetical protein